MKRLLLILFFIPLSAYDAKGTHYIATYKECDQEALSHVLVLYSYFLVAIEQSGATILKHEMYRFEPHGITGVALLSESHASIHTYPEHGCCFVDLFTCGDSCKWEEFEKVMVELLSPQHISRTVMVRE